MSKTFEIEKKYLIDHVNKTKPWDKEHIVYQWYVRSESKKSTKIKLIFDLLNCKIIFVKVTKENVDFGKSEKTIEYLNFNSFLPQSLIGFPFVLKRRSILGKIFLDKMIRSNNVCQYLLEDEGDNPHNECYTIVSEVTMDYRYYNQNMCTTFTESDCSFLLFLVSVFSFKETSAVIN